MAPPGLVTRSGLSSTLLESCCRVRRFVVVRPISFLFLVRRCSRLQDQDRPYHVYLRPLATTSSQSVYADAFLLGIHFVTVLVKVHVIDNIELYARCRFLVTRILLLSFVEHRPVPLKIPL